ncbi:Txe/YoeB family addiction module toxin [Lacihabitans sp. LS3-19]|uniref:Txe/YoeB family addiction module toxin n=1 Tax=Lacihabitans sp. LS3-19 TaxID=2487335 RepID=UPI0020CE9337|nr:Txe/YoeB family addiction module toxin [Lacihabitans sp. LS3-19]MCP9766671.1 Txe/YoeB family addiction module toxin [Lacihabitans sp. LS3-19]
MRSIKFLGESFEEFNNWGIENKQIQKRIVRLIQEIRRTPFEGIGKPEPLKNTLSGFWSRRIDDEHRIIYEVKSEEIIIHSIKGHYI